MMASTFCGMFRQQSQMLGSFSGLRAIASAQRSLITRSTPSSNAGFATRSVTRPIWVPRIIYSSNSRPISTTCSTHARKHPALASSGGTAVARVQPAPKLNEILDASDTPTFTPTAMGRSLMETLELEEMYHRKQQREFPEFRSGSIVRVTYQEARSRPSLRRLVGIVISKVHTWKIHCAFVVNRGLASHFTIRNVMEGMAFEKRFSLYEPLVHDIEVLDLARRRKSKLYYLNDRPLKDSTISQKYMSNKTFKKGDRPRVASARK